MLSPRFLARWTLTASLVAAATTGACGGSTATNAGIGPGGGPSNPSGGGPWTGGAGSGASGGAGGSACIVGTQGCLCDTSGGCPSGLTCTPQGTSLPSVCCSGGNCGSPAGSGVGATCGAATGSGASCTPGITVPPATGGNDSCGYPATSFVESTTLCGIDAVGGGAQPAVIRVFYGDEHALTLGCATAADPVSALPSNPGSVKYPQTGDPACVDAVGRPLRPVLYVTDLTADPSCTAGDQQHGGHPYDPVAVFGTWKSAAEGAGNIGTPARTDPMPGNKWNLGPSADAVPTFAPACGDTYGAELRFEVGLTSGHSYRFQVIVHDGDQNKGGDSGEACAVYCAGSGSQCPAGVQACVSGSVVCAAEGTSCVQGCCVVPGPPLPGPSFDAGITI